ncbi:hypothetical protein [Brevibacillus choshinensis]|uniref:Uncharacterized protein n=1 Tax=Brevibacillus choshinensis TaxID=54911 RepID=A0ABX7FHH7_BRECH|nr:hypothetical protein [Brevibacillus choshinensis]QRG65228.1 hypothetical protein JNE38_16420 [Brevibacillus choshinensis]
MKIKYEIKVIELSNGIRTLSVSLPKQMDAVSDFLHSDVQWEGDSNRILNLIDKVLNGFSNYEIAQGNACRIEIKKDNTKVVNFLYENLEEHERVESNIETQDLRSLVVEWGKNLLNLKNNNN